MQEAGYDGRPIILMNPKDTPTLHNAALVTAQLLRMSNVNVQIPAMDWSTLRRARGVHGPTRVLRPARFVGCAAHDQW